LGFQFASALYGLVLIGLDFRIFLLTTANEVADPTVDVDQFIDHGMESWDTSIATFSSFVIVLCLLYILTCIFVILLFCGGVCCGELIDSNVCTHMHE
jgi:hypothetical protein